MQPAATAGKKRGRQIVALAAGSTTNEVESEVATATMPVTVVPTVTAAAAIPVPRRNALRNQQMIRQVQLLHHQAGSTAAAASIAAGSSVAASAHAAASTAGSQGSRSVASSSRGILFCACMVKCKGQRTVVSQSTKYAHQAGQLSWKDN